MITAEEARKLTQGRAGRAVQQLDEPITQAADAGRRNILIPGNSSMDLDLWIHGGLHETDEYKKAKEALEKMGYTVEFHKDPGNDDDYAEHYIEIKW